MRLKVKAWCYLRVASPSICKQPLTCFSGSIGVRVASSPPLPRFARDKLGVDQEPLVFEALVHTSCKLEALGPSTFQG